MGPVETYLFDLQQTHFLGEGVAETSFYPALRQLLNEVGQTLNPRVRCVVNIRNRGAGIPDGGLFSADQFRGHAEDESALGTLPARGAIEVKPPSENVDAIADSRQARRYLAEYGQVLITNLREFLLVVQDADGQPEPLERYTIAANERDFWMAARLHRATAEQHGERLADYLKRVMLHAASLARPRDVAWFLASYAREARARIEASDLTELRDIRQALEESLGITFTGERGDHFFRSTLVQTLFYGVFSAWVLWSKRHPPASRERFNWHESAWFSNVPVIAALFEQISTPRLMRELNLVEVLDWAGMALNRVDRAAFFAVFEEGNEAVQYFYEPFLEAFDPELRKELGVWYTPNEVVRYMVSRVDTVLREELGIANGLADERVVVLDPACGTGSYLVEVLRQIAARLQQSGDALWAHDLKRAATERIIGFEILPAPFVVSHLPIGLLLENLGAPLASDGGDEERGERAAVYLTNSLTGWTEDERYHQTAHFPELREEHDAAEGIKLNAKVLVVLGNPPYNGYAGLAMKAERSLVESYRIARQTRQPQGQGLNDLYVRFFRMAERQIVEQTGKGIVCFISNYSWLDGLSHPAMRERYFEVFDQIWIDNLNGDKYKTGKLTPQGDPDPSIFSTERNREGIQVGTAIALLVRDEHHIPASTVRYRDLWGRDKTAELKVTAAQSDTTLYQEIEPQRELGLPFTPMRSGADYLTWPLLPELFPTSFPGVKTSRDDSLVDIDRDALIERMHCYFDPTITNDEMRHIAPSLMDSTQRFNAVTTRAYLVQRGFRPENIVRYLYRPFDVRWLYWEPETKLLDEKRSEYFPHVFHGNLRLEAREHQPKDDFDRGLVTQCFADQIGNGMSSFFPVLLQPSAPTRDLFNQNDNLAPQPSPNISREALAYLFLHGHESHHGQLQPPTAPVVSLFYHAVATIHDVIYRIENAGALRQDWPRIPLPNTAELLEASAKLGERIAALLDPLQAVSGVTQAPLRAELAAIGPVTRVGGWTLGATGDDLR